MRQTWKTFMTILEDARAEGAEKTDDPTNPLETLNRAIEIQENIVDREAEILNGPHPERSNYRVARQKLERLQKSLLNWTGRDFS